jgi:hypothetical protein
MNEKTLKHNSFWVILFIGAYVISIWLSFYRVYIREDYPIFYSEEEMPDTEGQLQILKDKFNL